MSSGKGSKYKNYSTSKSTEYAVAFVIALYYHVFRKQKEQKLDKNL